MTSDRVAHYRLGPPLGQGAMALVYRAVDDRDGREVALKLLPRARDPETRKRFLREARLAASLEHPNVVACLEAGQEGELIYIALELVAGETLRARLARGRLPLAEALAIAGDVARGLEHAHGRGVLHRDLKPANIMLAGDGSAKILDFGLAHRLGEEVLSADALETRDTTVETEAGRLIGTPGYMAPEQVRGVAVDARADVFAFGAVLYELLTGAPAFPGADGVARVLATVQRHPARPSQLDARVPASLENVVLRCLAKEPADRFADCGALRAALDAAGRGTAARRTVAIGLGGAAALALLALVAVGLMAGPRGKQEALWPEAGATRAGEGAPPPVTRPAPTAPAGEAAQAVPPSRAAALDGGATPVPAGRAAARPGPGRSPAITDGILDPFAPTPPTAR